MSNVIVNKEKIDLLANAISAKSGEALTLTLDEMVSAVDGIETGGGITPTGNIDITSAGVTDVTNYATATVPQGEMYAETSYGYYTENNQLKWRYRGYAQIESGDDYGTPGYIDDHTTVFSDWQIYNAIASGTFITPTESAQTIGGANTMLEGAVTVNAIPSNYVGSGVTQRTSSDLSASGATVTAPSGYYASSASKSVASGTEGTPTATKGAVNNHSIAVTPSVTNSAGYISGGTHNGTAVSVSASELVSGNLPITQNGDNIDVTNYATVSVNVSGGGGGMSISTSSTTLNAPNASVSFTGLQGEPTSFVITTAADLTTGAAPYKTATVVYDGTNVFGQYITNTSNANVTYGTTFSQSYNNGTLTVTGTGSNFQANEYKLVYTYGGSSSNIGTSDVQVGSGATSITFTDLIDEPSYFSVAFKNNFGTSSGYQRVISVVYDGNTTYGLAMDSEANAQTSWSYTYNNGSLTISSTGTNNGGYFHQPGYYQLTYGVGGTVELDIQPLNVTTNGTYQQSGVAYSPVVVNVSGGGGTLSYDTKTATASNYPVSLEFTGMKGQPKFFAVRLNAQVSSSGSTTYYYIVDIISNCNGSSAVTHGNCFRIGSTRRVDNITSGYSWSYSGTTLTITSSAASRSASPGAFYSGSYELLYAY